MSTLGTLVFAVALVLGFIAPDRFFHLPVFALFAIFMAAMSMRNISVGSLSTRVPRTTSAPASCRCSRCRSTCRRRLGAFISSQLLHNTPDGKLAGIDRISTLSLVLAFTLPPLLAVIVRRVTRARGGRRGAVAAPAQPAA